ncbi:MAG TPA: hypothetical protein VFW40_06815 [Capsulimonadaceae bacterium]|nr:hypothetical protein [Capsulimonadaceae bacterium]
MTRLSGDTGTFNSDNEITNTGYSNDVNGNPTIYKNMSLTYDPEHRLTADGSLDTYAYNGDRPRAWRNNCSDYRRE